MRALIWIVVLFAAAVAAALTFGRNDGIVSIFWAGWRTDLSLNLFLVALIAACGLLIAVVHGLARLASLPRRAHEWRQARRERASEAALREAMAELINARYGRARKAARRALELHEPARDAGAATPDFAVLSLLLAATAAHRMQDRAARQTLLQDAQAAAKRRAAGAARGVEDGVHLLAAQWALDEHDPAAAQASLAQLSPGAARRTQALRLRLAAARGTRQPLLALQITRLLANHQAFSPLVARGLVRALVGEALDDVHDIQHLRRLWQHLEADERRDPRVAVRAAQRALRLQENADARQWLRPFWERLGELDPGERADIALTLAEATEGITPDWLPGLESAAQNFGHDSAIVAAVGAAYSACGLYGKARGLLRQAAESASLAPKARRAAWRELAALARREGDEAATTACERAAAQLD
jgi:HemY protein